VTSSPIKVNKEPMQIQLRIDTASNFSVGLDDLVSPSEITIEIDYKVSLKTQDTEKLVAEYNSKYIAQFNIVAWLGFEDWMNVPHDALAPYFAIAQNISLRRAENTFSDMGFNGVVLPQPTSFDANGASLIQGVQGSLGAVEV
jgi:hypothetical protein